ncbi:hypothetical protein [Desulfopila aestuarii]|uniref:Uncharacterized protein n=1 Tax=Desulfopila aestuarii DSM 18488 TaxID=1121416 RepID=A0A1M7XY70_9BACT|nr:hypothetical protein [Desulfopila aestuarii]SHO43938.1 hypothetical protein SAMN02745220_00576 [Desulfopila aestuarii DSM 18488]
MESWYALEVENGVKYKKLRSRLLMTFDALYLKLGAPRNMGVYSKTDAEKNIVTLYFTPVTRTIAEKFGAAECEAPAKAGLELNMGPDTCLEFYSVEAP